MTRLSRTSSASSQSYTTLPSSLDAAHHDSMSYYQSHQSGHHSRMASLSSTGAGASGSVAYYNHISDDMSSPAALGDGNGGSSMAVVPSQADANQVAYQHQHMPLMGQSTSTVMSNGAANGRAGPIRTSDASSVLGSVGSIASAASVASSIGSNNSGHGRSYQVQMPESALPAHMHQHHQSQNQHPHQNQHQHVLQQMPRTSSGAWSPQDDEALLQARARGENWAQIQTLFHGKTPNACRKRHERLMERRNANDFDSRKMEHIAREYMSMRRELWQPLAQKTGEKWTVVEQKCMASGLKNLQGVARAAGRRHRLESAYVIGGGVGGINGIGGHYGAHYGGHGHGHGHDHGLDDDLEVDVDVDLLDGAGMSASVGSPSSSPHGIGGGNRSVSGGSNSSGASRQQLGHVHGHGHAQSSYAYSHAPAHAQPHHHQHTLSGSSGEVGGSPGYPDYYTPAGFSQSLRAVEAPAAAMTSPYASQQHAHSHTHQPRMASGDMGIDALLRR